MQIGIIGFGALGQALKSRVEQNIKQSKISVFTNQLNYLNQSGYHEYCDIVNFNGPILVAVKGEKIFNALKYIEIKNDVYIFTKSLINGKFIMDYVENRRFRYVRGLLFAKDVESNVRLGCSVFNADNTILKDDFLTNLNFSLQQTGDIRLSELISIYKNPLAIYFGLNNLNQKKVSTLLLNKICLIKEGSLPIKIAHCIIRDYEVCISSTKSRNFIYGLNLKNNVQNKYIPEGVKYFKDLTTILNSKISLTYGTFDLFHYGHLKLLKRARKTGDFLIVGLSTDEFNKQKFKIASQNFYQRVETLKSIKFIDLIISEDNWDQKLSDIESYQVDSFIMGDDWKGKFDDLKKFCKVIYLERTPDISSTELRNLKEKNKI